MFQNISEEIEENEIENNIENKKGRTKYVLKNILKPQNIVLYLIAGLISTLPIMNGLAPFGLAIFAACCSTGVAAFPVFIVCIIGTIIGFGKDGALLYLLNSFILLGLMLLIKPKRQKDIRNERRKLGMHLMLAIFIVQALKIFSASFMVMDVLQTILNCLVTYIFYKIFVNSISVIDNLGTSKVFTVEEAIGAVLLTCIAVCALNPIVIYGFSLTNIICFVLVLALAWRNGVLVGVTTGVTVSIVLNILGFADTALIAIYAVAGMIIGFLSRVGNLGLIATIIAGIAIITYVNNIPNVILIEEALIASVFLLVLPRKLYVDIEDVIGKTTLLPVTKEKRLSENKEAIFKLNGMSKTIDEMAKSYEEAAATVVEDQKENIEKNREIFIEDLKDNLETINNNILYDVLMDTENGIVNDIFEVLIKNGEIESEDIIEIFEKHNSYIIGIESNEEADRQMEKQIYQIVKNINYTYQVSKLNFIWKQKVSQNNKIISEQLSNVSKVINNMAKEINDNKEENNEKNEEKFNITIGSSRTTKNDSKISGDSSTQMKLQDGKYLLAISDGMGTGPKARNNSKKAINMLENLLVSGFNKEESIELINSALNTNVDEDMYSTLDVSIIDLAKGNIEFIKNGSAPTYIKTSDGVQIVKESSMPAGMVSKAQYVAYDRDLEDGDIIVMCSDGIIDSSGESDENWLKELLEKIQTTNVQKIADIIIQEAIDNGLGIARDDMTIIVAKVREIK